MSSPSAFIDFEPRDFDRNSTGLSAPATTGVGFEDRQRDPSVAGPGFVNRLIKAVTDWNDVRVTRNVLYGLSDRMLDDLGLSRGDIAKIGTHNQLGDRWIWTR